MSYFNIANSRILFISVSIGILCVLGIALIHLQKAWKRAKETGMDMERMKDVVKASASFAIIPSIAIIIGMFSLMAMLGIPWPWFRLSVIGSVAYEILAADSALKALGTEIAAIDATAFVTIMYVMSICILSMLIFPILLSKKIQEGAMNMKSKDERWGVLGNSTFMLSIVIVIMTPMLLDGGVGALTWLTSFFTTIVLGVIMKKFSLHWLSNFILATSLLVAMVSSVFWTNLIG